MDRIFVIAGDQHQASHWIKNHMDTRVRAGINPVSKSDYVYVASPEYLRGVRDPHGVFIGTWRKRKDIVEIVEALFMACTHVNRGLQRIRDEVRLKSKKPTPKLHPTSGGWSIAVDEAAGLLAQEIDRQVLQQASQQTISYDQMLPSMIQAIQELNKRTQELENARDLAKP